MEIPMYGGDNFITKERIPDEKQWVNILQQKLKENYLLLQEGLPGRLAGSLEKEKNIRMEKIHLYLLFEHVHLLI